jgi:hypothetical protein
MGESPAERIRRSGRGNHNWLDQRKRPSQAGGGGWEGHNRRALSRFRVIGGQCVFAAHLKAMRERLHEFECIGRSKTVIASSRAMRCVAFPHRDAVGAPITAQRPAGQRLAWIPFALAVVKQRAGRHLLAQALDQGQPAGSLDCAESVDVPLRALGIVDADVGRLAAHGQAHILRLQFRVHAVGNLSYAEPFCLGKRLGGLRGVIQAANGDGMTEIDVGTAPRCR